MASQFVYPAGSVLQRIRACILQRTLARVETLARTLGQCCEPRDISKKSWWDFLWFFIENFSSRFAGTTSPVVFFRASCAGSRQVFQTFSKNNFRKTNKYKDALRFFWHFSLSDQRTDTSTLQSISSRSHVRLSWRFLHVFLLPRRGALRRFFFCGFSLPLNSRLHYFPPSSSPDSTRKHSREVWPHPAILLGSRLECMTRLACLNFI